MTSNGFELFGYVSFRPGGAEDREPTEFDAVADYTADTAEANPGWQLDLCDEVVGSWRGEDGNVAAMTLVWGRPLVAGGAIVTGELADLAVDQCTLVRSASRCWRPTATAATRWTASSSTPRARARARIAVRGLRGGGLGGDEE